MELRAPRAEFDPAPHRAALCAIIDAVLAEPALDARALDRIVRRHPMPDGGLFSKTAIIAGFVGVVLVLDPSTEGIGWPALMALVGTMLYAGVNVLTRMLRDAGPETLIGWHAAGTFMITGAVAPFVWVPIGLADFGLAVVLAWQSGAELFIAWYSGAEPLLPHHHVIAWVRIGALLLAALAVVVTAAWPRGE